MNTFKNKQVGRTARRRRVRAKVFGTKDKPRLAVFRSLRYTYAQVIDDVAGRTLAQARSAEIKLAGSKTSLSFEVGKLLAKRATEAGIKQVVFDRGGYKYHGRVKALADAAREGGLEF